MLDNPFRLQVLINLCEALKAIRPSNGYEFDMSDINDGAVVIPRVYRGVTVFGESHPPDLISVLESPDVTLPVTVAYDGASGEYNFDLLIQGFVEDDPINPTDRAHLLSAEIRKALSVESKRFVYPDGRGGTNILGLGSSSPCVKKLIMGNPIVRPADGEISIKSFIWQPLRLVLVEDLEKPYG